jgi:hypothetical protein
MRRLVRSRRPTVERLARDCLDVRELKRRGLLHDECRALPGGLRWPSIGRIISERYWLTLELRSTIQQIRVSWTPCHLGGWRPWMHCPHCQTRVAILLNGMGGYHCRACIGKPLYASQAKGANNRRHFEICKVRLQLGGMPPPS